MQDLYVIIFKVYFFFKDKLSIGSLKKRIELRNEDLKKLLEIDSEKFGWLTEKLKIKYTLPTKYDKFLNLPKRAERKRVARDAAIALVKQKSLTLQKKLEEELVRFNKYKEQQLSKIKADLKELGIEEVPLTSNCIYLIFYCSTSLKP